MTEQNTSNRIFFGYLAIVTLCFIGFTVTAQAQSWNQKIDGYARDFTGHAYGYTARTMCGGFRPCGTVGRRIGVGVYDRAQRYTNIYGNYMQDVGSRIRNRYDNRNRYRGGGRYRRR